MELPTVQGVRVPWTLRLAAAIPSVFAVYLLILDGVLASITAGDPSPSALLQPASVFFLEMFVGGFAPVTAVCVIVACRRQLWAWICALVFACVGLFAVPVFLFVFYTTSFHLQGTALQLERSIPFTVAAVNIATIVLLCVPPSISFFDQRPAVVR